MVATALVVTGWTATGPATVGAAEPSEPGPGLALDERVAQTGSLRTVDDVRALQDDQDAAGGVRVAVVTDDNGTAAGGLDVTALTADPGQVEQLTETLATVPGVLSAEVDTRIGIAEDPYASQQYSTAMVRADRVRSAATGAGVVVAVIDTGVQSTHADLAPTVAGGAPRVLRGTTFLTPDSGRPNLSGSPGTTDSNGHGTHVAGIIAAARGNGIGVEGIAPDAQILPVRALDGSGFGWSSDIAASIMWSHQQGADVINLSLAGPGESATISAAINSVSTDTSRGKAPTVVIAAAGNSGANYSLMWPAAHPRVIAVGSTDSLDRVASTSSRGSYLDVTAPGVNILSTCAPSGYCFRSGTSMASPLVAGAAALLRQQDPGRDGAAIETILERSTFDVDRLGFDTSSGWGRIDVATALDPARNPRVPRPVRLPSGIVDAVTTDGRFVMVVGRATDPDDTPIVSVASTVNGRRTVRDVWAIDGRWGIGYNGEPGTHRICVDVLDTPTRRPVSLGCWERVVK